MNKTVALAAILAAAIGAGSALAQAQLTTEDRLQIMELAARHNVAIDEMNLDAYAQVYAPNAVLVTPNGTLTGREAIRQGLADYRLKAAGNRHQTLNFIIAPNPDGSASMTSYFLTTKVDSNTASRETPYTLSHAIHKDLLVKSEGQWVIARREQIGVSTRQEPW